MTKLFDFYKRNFLAGCVKISALLLMMLVMVSCQDEPADPEPDPIPVSTFNISIGEGNYEALSFDEPSYYPDMYIVVMRMEDLPANEKIVYMGGMYSTENPTPDFDDYTLIYDYSDYDEIQNWDWENEPLYWRCMYLLHPQPGKTYYVRGYVQTDKGEYFTNVFEFHSECTNPTVQNPEAYEIPVIFHLFPDEDGSYPIKESKIIDQLDYANYVYGNSYNIPGQTDTGVRFVAATHTPDGVALKTPGIVYEEEPLVIDYGHVEIDDKYVWDMEYALNVWVCPIVNTWDNGNVYSLFGGFSYLPFFDADEMLEGCNQLEDDNICTGIFLNSVNFIVANNTTTFAHEAGHFLSLEHVFAEGDDFCADTPWYDYEEHCIETQGDIDPLRRSANGAQFWSDNIMDYDYGFMTGFTPDQRTRIQYTLQHAYFIPGPAGKECPAVRSATGRRRFSGRPVS